MDALPSETCIHNQDTICLTYLDGKILINLDQKSKILVKIHTCNICNHILYQNCDINEKITGSLLLCQFYFHCFFSNVQTIILKIIYVSLIENVFVKPVYCRKLYPRLTVCDKAHCIRFPIKKIIIRRSTGTMLIADGSGKIRPH